MPIKLTPSNLAYWFSSQCPAAWKFDQEWESLASKEWADRGTLVHGMMEGMVARKDVEDKLALTFYDKLNAYWKESGFRAVLKPDGQPFNEIKQRFRIAPGVDLSRKLDKLVYDEDGETLAIDWKTTPGYGWKAVTGPDYVLHYPQAHGFQSIGYLLPPPVTEWERLGLPKRFKWPKRILYVVAPLRGAIQVLSYDWSKEGHENFVHATEVAIPSVKRKHFPKIEGKQCHECTFKALCHQTPGWETGYRLRSAARRAEPSEGETAAA